MKIGMPALIEFDTIEENVKLCKELSLNFVELNMNFPYNMINNIDPYYLRSLSSKNNIEFTMHMPDDADTASFYDSVAQAYLDLFINTIKWAKEADVKLLNMHITKGAYMTLSSEKVYINEKYSDQYVPKFLDSIRIISEQASKCGINVCIENNGNFSLNYVQKILDMALSYDNIYLTWDVGHDYMSNYSDRGILLKYKDKIKHMHLHDATKYKDHVVLREGSLNVEECIDFARSNKLTTLVEVKSRDALIKSIYNINKHN